MRRDVRILLVGDDGVGKSTLITSLIKETFVQNVQHVVPEVTIPPEVTPESVTTHIIDSSPAPEDRAHLEHELRRAHVVCIVYAINSPNSFDRLPTFWLPYIRSLGVNVPVILVGNKIDLRGGEVTNQALEEEIVPIMNEFKEVETCVECSAKLSLNVSEVFYFAQKAVLHPTAPLYDSREHSLKPSCVNALRRIFKLCDINKDGVLDDAELNEFQRKCFDAPLQLQELEGIKDVVRSYSPSLIIEPNLPTMPGGITEEGFLYLHTLFIQRGRLETTWTVLRRFGYGEDLELREEFLRPKFDVPADCSVELAPNGYQFFTDIFEIHDKDKDGALKPSELENLFSTSPGNPWAGQAFPNTTVTDESGAVTLQGWLAQWSMTTLLDYRTTLAYLAYLGYPSTVPPTSPSPPFSSPLSPTASPPTPFPSSSAAPSQVPTTTALHITRPRKTDRKKGKVSRNVFLCYVLGATGSGKTALLRGLVGKGFDERWEPTRGEVSVVGAVETKGVEKYLVLQEFGSKYESETLRSSKKLQLADVIVYVYDSSDTNSFSYISNLRQQYKLDAVPSLFVATKSDLDLAQQRHEVQPDVYCRKLGLQGPVSVSIKTGQTADLYNVICSVAMNPTLHIPGGPSPPSSRLRLYFSLTALAGTVTVTGVVLYRTWKGREPFGWLWGGSGAGGGGTGAQAWLHWITSLGGGAATRKIEL